jgi:hypothetical protein
VLLLPVDSRFLDDEKLLSSTDKDYQDGSRRQYLELRAGFNQKGFSSVFRIAQLRYLANPSI